MLPGLQTNFSNNGLSQFCSFGNVRLINLTDEGKTLGKSDKLFMVL